MKARVLLAVFVLLLGCYHALASDDIQVGNRHVRYYLRPALPEVAKKMNLRGPARLEIDIAPSGKVIAVRPLGGHPLLLDSASKAVRYWQFDSASQATTGTVTINFE